MGLSLIQMTPVLLLIFLVALIYSSVGHGGASGYLALLSFFSVPHEEMAMSALRLNLLVAGTAFWTYRKAGYFSWSLTWPFLAASVPAAFLGGFLEISSGIYALLLAGVLFYAALRLAFDFETEKIPGILKPPSLKVALPVGGGVGILSGLVGVGGGIFLSPLILLSKWAPPKETAAASALFIFVNSLAGIFGRHLRQNFELYLSPALGLMMAAAFLGGWAGSRLGARHFSGRGLKRILALVLAAASFKLIRGLG
ncbi:MAG: sulfite exporter TauE/SafE family protein [Candidatus Omnitrophica bacterium]|nr:sulfite exporter TauE/SafE family protein [Candidatus Omnitrophota bacterium]